MRNETQRAQHLYPGIPGPNSNRTSIYEEKMFTGYRWYDQKNIAPQFPFGHGLSYT